MLSFEIGDCSTVLVKEDDFGASWVNFEPLAAYNPVVDRFAGDDYVL
jgi:hypothetical protein